MAEEGAYEEATDEEKLQVAQRMLLASPPGQIIEVLRDVATLVPAHVLTDAALRAALHAYNVTNFVPVNVPDADYKILICEEGQVDASHYVDVIGHRVLGFDHVRQQVVPGDVAELPKDRVTDFEAEREQVQQALQSYLQFEYMHGGTAGVYLVGTKLVVNLCTERINLRNFWGGRWKSQWNVHLTRHPVCVTGTIHLHVHYFENGNLQLQSAKEVTQEISSEDHPLGGLGDAIVRVIKEAEDTLQQSLEDMYRTMSEETFKEMRRVMPVTRTKMDWSVHAHRTAKQFRNTT